MRHRVVFREITTQDLDRNCPFMPQEHEFEMHLNGLVHDVSWLDGVADVVRDGPQAIVVTTEESAEALKNQLIPILQNHWTHLRFAGLETLTGSQA